MAFQNEDAGLLINNSGLLKWEYIQNVGIEAKRTRRVDIDASYNQIVPDRKCRPCCEKQIRWCKYPWTRNFVLSTISGKRYKWSGRIRKYTIVMEIAKNRKVRTKLAGAFQRSSISYG